jgi:uncharacterized protein with HEPN domain
MSRSDTERLADMAMAIDEIASIVKRGRKRFDGDVVLRRAIERCLEILGEAAKSVSDDVRAVYPLVPWSDLSRGTRPAEPPLPQNRSCADLGDR